MRIWIALLVLGGAVAHAAEEEDKEAKRAQDYLRAGLKRLEGGKFQEALNAFKRGSEHKFLPEFHYYLGQCHRQLGDGEAAAREYRAFLGKMPDASERAEVERYLAEIGGGSPPPPGERKSPGSGAPPPSPPKGERKNSPPPPPPLGAPERCEGGKLVTIATNGHCCWREQIWSDDNRVCIGIPRCPKDHDVRGTDCVRQGGEAAPSEAARPSACPAGKVKNNGHCCWPEQVWAEDSCIGVPECPRSFALKGRDCVRKPTEEE
ncbi:MAG: hypothetical protein EXR72_05560 [Myxococcales bacterium]|nr:hypothetical protein [Myxococcales bacterium]